MNNISIVALDRLEARIMELAGLLHVSRTDRTVELPLYHRMYDRLEGLLAAWTIVLSAEPVPLGDATEAAAKVFGIDLAQLRPRYQRPVKR